MTKGKVATTATVHASAERIFALLTDPSKHPLIDGSGTVQSTHNVPASQRLELGSTFGMDMKTGLSYRVTNKVVEFEPNRLIAWRHMARHRWRWELKPIDENTTEVTETFDWSTTPAGPILVLLGYPARNLKGMEATLRRLETVLAEEPSADEPNADGADGPGADGTA